MGNAVLLLRDDLLDPTHIRRKPFQLPGSIEELRHKASQEGDRNTDQEILQGGHETKSMDSTPVSR